MASVEQILVKVERELSKGHAEVPEKLLTQLLKSLNRRELGEFHDQISRLTQRFQPKRRKRLSKALEKAVAKGGGTGPSGEANGGDNGDTSVLFTEDAGLLKHLDVADDGRVSAWQIPEFLRQAAGHRRAIEVIDEQVQRFRRAGDPLGAGEWAAAKLLFVEGPAIEPIVAELLSAWSSPPGTVRDVESLSDLVQNRSMFSEGDMATALAAVVFRLTQNEKKAPQILGDLAYKLQPSLKDTLKIQESRKRELCPRAAAVFSSARSNLVVAVQSFEATTPATAKEASVNLIRATNRFRKVTIASERPLLSEVQLLVGPEFRKLCEDYQNHRTDGILRRTPALKQHAQSLLERSSDWLGATAWKEVVEPVAKKVVDLAEQIIASTRTATAPKLRLSSTLFKLDLHRHGQDTALAVRLINEGMGRAKNVRLTLDEPGVPAVITVIDPRPGFDLSGSSEQLLKLSVRVDESRDSLEVPVRWHYETITGRKESQAHRLQLEQQMSQPNWEHLKSDPPYSHNPVQERERLFGRDAVLETLSLNAMAYNSCFVWGQKRIGKTSLLQVLAKELRERPDVACVFLRMGEVKGLHEGQFAHRIAERFGSDLGVPDVPEEQYFGASMARLIPWVEQLLRNRPGSRLVLIIDEFDDLDPAYYTGERGAQFVKQLRSLSEVGLTFFLAGSERMGEIYARHDHELNKWTNVHLDTIESRADCQELITRPVRNSIEYEAASVDEIVEYCGGNPFYMHLLCFSIFQLCMREQRTFVSMTDVEEAKQRLMRTSGETNFAHFWLDNPTLAEPDHEMLAAECSLVLTLISRAGGSFDSSEDLLRAQGDSDLEAAERLPRSRLDHLVPLLIRRRVLGRDAAGMCRIQLPILRSWLSRQSETVLLPKWKTFRARMAAAEKVDVGADKRATPFVGQYFPISEDDLLTVAQPLTYLGRQVDVARIRTWLSQFDDEIRIELAYMLLRRLVEEGYISDGAYAHKIQMLTEAVREKRRVTGQGAWKEFRGRKDNLAVTYVDGDLKSGGTLTRELRNRLRPGKAGRPDGLSQWLKSHVDEDALLLVADDFAASGESLVKGLKRLYADNGEIIKQYANEGRVLCYSLFGLADALDRLKEEFPDVDVAFMQCFGDEVRALSPEAGIFERDEERAFAEEMLIQVGRELVSQFPLGFGSMGLLVCFHNTIPNNTLPVFWSNGTVAEKPWEPLFPRP